MTHYKINMFLNEPLSYVRKASNCGIGLLKVEKNDPQLYEDKAQMFERSSS